MFLLSSSYAKNRGVHVAIKSAFINLMPFCGDTVSLALVILHPHGNYLLHQLVTKLTWILLWWFTCSVGKAPSQCCEGPQLVYELDLSPALQSFCVSSNDLCISAVPKVCVISGSAAELSLTTAVSSRTRAITKPKSPVWRFWARTKCVKVTWEMDRGRKRRQ